MSELKQYPASELKLERLRRSGIVAKSLDVSSFAVVVGFIAGSSVLLGRYWPSLLRFAEESFKATQPVSFESFSSEFVWALMSFFASFFLVVWIVNWLQVKFLFSPMALVPDFGRVLAFRENLLGGIKERFVVAGIDVVKVISWLFVVWLTFHYAGRLFSEHISGATGVLVRDQAIRDSTALPYKAVVTALLNRAMLVGIVFVAIIALLSWFSAMLRFSAKQQMTRGEVEAENRELEASPELRQAFRGARDD